MITPEMMLWLLNNHPASPVSGLPNLTIQRLTSDFPAAAGNSVPHIRCYCGGTVPQSDASDLTVVPDVWEDHFRESARRNNYRGGFLVVSPSAENSGFSGSHYAADDHSDVPASPSIGDDPSDTLSVENDSSGTLSAADTAFRIADELHQLLDRLLLWDRDFTSGILSSRDDRELLASLTEILPLDFCVSDVDMNLLYRTEGYARSRGLSPDDHFPADVFQDLISHTEFHAAAKKKEMFYYYTAATDTTSRCSNLFVNDQYIGRLVILLPVGESRLPQGGEEMCALCARRVQDLFDHHNLTPGRHSNDAMHRLCRSLAVPVSPSAEGTSFSPGSAFSTSSELSLPASSELSLSTSSRRPSAAEAEHILSDYGWKREDTYSAIVLSFTTEPGWDAHLSLTLPFLALDLERNWANSCAISFDTEILMVVNHSRDDRGEDRRDFLQRIAYFVRDNICKAGVSPYYRDFLLLCYARKAADAALRLGMTDKPHLWYYLFDDLRLPYLMEELAGTLPSSMLIHPAIRTLMDYDTAHGSELTHTLEIYLTHNLNMTAAADALFIHRTSFCRRMNHIRSLTGLKSEDPDTILTLLISFRLLAQGTVL